MPDQIDLEAATVVASPDVRAWPITRQLTAVSCTPAGGFVLTFDQPLPESWKWPSNPDVPSDNFQYTVWIFLRRSGQWIGAGFVQMWAGRAMGTGALPAIFADDAGVPGWRNWWGDVRNLWAGMADYVPAPGDVIGLMVSAGNARLRRGVTSVAERSNVVVATLRADDLIQPSVIVPPVVDPPVDPPVVVPPVNPPAPGDWLLLEQQIAALRIDVGHLMDVIAALAAKPAPTVKAPVYEGTVQIPFFGSAKITLTPKA